MNLRNVHDTNFATALELGRKMGMIVPDDAENHLAVEVDVNDTFTEQLSPGLRDAYPELAEEIMPRSRSSSAGRTAPGRPLSLARIRREGRTSAAFTVRSSRVLLNVRGVGDAQRRSSTETSEAATVTPTALAHRGADEKCFATVLVHRIAPARSVVETPQARQRYPRSPNDRQRLVPLSHAGQLIVRISAMSSPSRHDEPSSRRT
jgi:hypothetical protein